jgi:hypothetical protein
LLGFRYQYRFSRQVAAVVTRFKEQAGKVGWILLWLLGVPVPILIILFLVRGCT